MASKVIWNMSFFLYNLSMGCFKRVIFLHSIEFVGVVTSNQDNVGILVMEWTLIDKHVPSNSHLLVSEALGFIPHPQNDLPIGLTSLNLNFYLKWWIPKYKASSSRFKLQMLQIWILLHYNQLRWEPSSFSKLPDHTLYIKLFLPFHRQPSISWPS